jgi:Fe-Mn family superoxide dismutase
MAASSVALPYDSLPGVISSAALAEHVKLWAVYEQTKDKNEHALAGALLHELYFSGLAPTPTPVVLPVLHGALISAFGSVDAFWRDMAAAAMKSSGWALLAVRGNHDLRIIAQDDHNGGVPGYEPIMAIDTYEHAYWMDFGTRKADYLSALWKVINWPELERRWATVRSR